MGKDLYLTDEQYLELLDKIEEVLASGAPLYIDDCNDIGNKHTESNVGLCNDNLTTKETAMWPEEFPRRTDMKYSKDYHICPFDNRFDAIEKGKKKCMFNGCFYTCSLAKPERRVSRQRIVERLNSLKKLASEGKLKNMVKGGNLGGN